jgi:predicted regulator of Ras-like GTPase activity (Roadblock/LC7/MglB family)
MIVSHDGLTMISLGPVSDAERAGAMCADLLSLCRATAKELQRGDVHEVLVLGAEGCLLLTPAGPQAMLAVMARPDANLGMALAEARRAAAAIPGAL